LRAALAAAEARAEAAEAGLAEARAVVSCSEAMIKELRLEIAKLRREQYGRSSERGARLIDQLELQLEELEAAATEDALAAEQAAATTTTVRAFTRRRPVRKPFPEHLPRERVVIEAPCACSCCGSSRIVKMGEDITETLEVIPRQWKVIQTVREKFTCRDCEKISQPPAPFHATPRGWAGPNLLAMILFEKFGQHQPLNRQAERYAREGVPLSLSTLADQVGACTVALEPIHTLLERHVLGAERLHGDDTTVPLLARGGTKTARLWTYVRDDRPFAGHAPPAALFYFSPDREKTHPNRHLAGWRGMLQADAYGGFNDLYRPDREPGPVTSALCWAHARRKFFELADIAGNVRKGKPAHQISPVALEAVKRIDALFDIERGALRPAGREPARLAAPPAGANVQAQPRRQGHQLPPREGGSLARLHPVPRGWPHLPHQQRRRALAARRGPRPQVMALRRLRARRRSRGLHLHPDRLRQDERHRPPGLAGGRPRPAPQHARLTRPRASPLELEDSTGKRQSRMTAAYTGWLPLQQ
jgi:transposase